MALYTECARWCKEDDVTGIADLIGRIVGPERFERQWTERCQRVSDRLEEQ